MLEFNKILKQGDLIYSGNGINIVKSIVGNTVHLNDKLAVKIDDIRKLKISYSNIFLNIIKVYEKKGFRNLIIDLYYNIGLSDLTKSEFQDFYKNNTSTEELHKHVKYVSFSEKNQLGLTTHPLIKIYLETFSLNLNFNDNITVDFLNSLIHAMDDYLYGDLFKLVITPNLIYKNTKFITDFELRNQKIKKLLSNH